MSNISEAFVKIVCMKEIGLNKEKRQVSQKRLRRKTSVFKTEVIIIIIINVIELNKHSPFFYT